MFARIALRMSHLPLIRSPYARPTHLLASYVPAFHVRAGHPRALEHRRERPAAGGSSLLETAVRLHRAAAEAAAELARPYAGLDPADSTVLLR